MDSSTGAPTSASMFSRRVSPGDATRGPARHHWDARNGSQPHTLVESLTPPPGESSADLFYGLSTSDKTPLEILGCYLVAAAMGARVVTFVAGRFAVLNAKSAELVSARWEAKAREEAERVALIREIYANLRLDGLILNTADLWLDPAYWGCFAEVHRRFDAADIRRRLGSCPELPMRDWVAALGSAGVPFPAALAESDLPAALYYHPLQVAEVLYAKRHLECGWKAGSVDSEAIYDREIYTTAGVGIIHLRQPLVLDKPGRLRRASAYVATPSESKRLLMEDSPEGVAAKLSVPGNPAPFEAERLWKVYAELAGLDDEQYSVEDAVGVLQALGRRRES